MRFYVYALSDPRDGSTFYIGKGQKRRAWQHEIDARKGREGRKADRIREIIESGHSPRVEILKRFNDEVEAYIYEASLIKKNRASLLNIAHGGRGAMSGDDGKNTNWAAVAKEIGAFVIGTANFTKPHPDWMWHDGPQPVPTEVTALAKSMLKRLIDRFGREWFHKETGILFV